MFCVKCGKEVKKGTKFCTNCGAEIESVKKEEKEVKEEKLTYSQNKSIETTSNPEPVAVKPAESGDGKGTASLVLGIVSLLVWCVTPITAIIGLILGLCSKKSGKKTAGIILNAIALGLVVIGWIVLYSLGYMAEWMSIVSNTQTVPTTPSIITPSKPSTGRVSSTETISFDGFEITLGNNYEIVKDEKVGSSHYGDEVIKLPATIKNVDASGDHLNMYYHYYYGPTGTRLDKIMSDFGSAKEAIDYVHVNQGESKVQYFYILYDGDGKYTIEFSNYKDKKTVEFTIKK